MCEFGKGRVAPRTPELFLISVKRRHPLLIKDGGEHICGVLSVGKHSVDNANQQSRDGPSKDRPHCSHSVGPEALGEFGGSAERDERGWWPRPLVGRCRHRSPGIGVRDVKRS